jgi:hypothetical protein
VERILDFGVLAAITSALRADVKIDEECFKVIARTVARNAKTRSPSKEGEQRK